MLKFSESQLYLLQKTWETEYKLIIFVSITWDPPDTSVCSWCLLVWAVSDSGRLKNETIKTRELYMYQLLVLDKHNSRQRDLPDEQTMKK